MRSDHALLGLMIALYLALLWAAGLIVGLATGSVGFGLLGAFAMMCILPFVSTGARIWHQCHVRRKSAAPTP